MPGRGLPGADRTLSPYAVGGRRLTSLATQPLIVGFFNIDTRGEKGTEFRLEAFSVPESSPIVGRTLGEPRIGERNGAMILVTRSQECTFDIAPLGSGPPPRGRHPDSSRNPR